MEGKEIFSLQKQDGQARLGCLSIRGITIETPIFMPVGTNATVKAMRPEDLSALGYKLILANAYHLSLRPGDFAVAELGGLHSFMNWPGLILTDSGGFQAFSLSKFNKLEEGGFKFRSHLDGTELFLSPARAIEIQKNLNSDIAMCLDVCVSQPASFEDTKSAVELTSKWAQSCIDANNGALNLFGIIQGGVFPELRKASAEAITKLPFAGFAIGGVSVGETRDEIIKTLQISAPLLPKGKARYAMGVGDPVSMLFAIEAGVDMFDSVLATRIARNGSLFTSRGPISIKQAQWKASREPIDEKCTCYSCKNYSKAYLRHLHSAGEMLGPMLNTIHNLHFLQNFMQEIRIAIAANQFQQYKAEFLNNYNQKDIDHSSHAISQIIE